MKKTFAALILAAATATPAFASDGSEIVAHAQAQPGYAAMWNGSGAYASAWSVNRHRAQNIVIREQGEVNSINR